jgi:hypothetical protein
MKILPHSPSTSSSRAFLLRALRAPLVWALSASIPWYINFLINTVFLAAIVDLAFEHDAISY